MASPIHAAQNRQVELEARRKAMLAEGSTATAEEMEALVAEIAANDRDLAALKAMQDAERTAPATRQAGTVTPRVEQDPKRGFRSIGEFAQTVRSHQLAMSRGVGRPDERLLCVINETDKEAEKIAAELRAAGQEDTPAVIYQRYGAAAPTTLHKEGQSEDGLMVPPDFRRELWKPALEGDDLMSLMRVQPTESVVVQFAADETTPWGANGIKAYWVAEGAQLTASKLSTKPREVRLHKIGCLVYTTDELLMDTSLLSARINEWAPMAMGWTCGEAVMRGDGSGKPFGWEGSSAAPSNALVTVAKETSQPAATLVSENVLKMSSRMLAGPGSNLIWLANRDVLPQMASLKIGNEPSWVGQNQGLKDAPNGMLLGSPIQWSEHCNTLGTSGDIQYINTSGMAVFVHSSGTRVDSSIHLYFDYDISAFRFIQRIGAQPYLTAAISPFKGANTKSHFIYLATRS